MNVLKQANALNTTDRIKFVDELQVSDVVAVMTLTYKTTEGIYVEGFTADGIHLSDGKIFNLDGVLEVGPYCTKILFKPDVESREEYLSRRLRNKINQFRWTDLTSNQLDAVLKYAESKLIRQQTLPEKE